MPAASIRRSCARRGSAANSLVCYPLGDDRSGAGKLLFSRFLSENRNEPPDIDVDFEHERREEVIQYIYAAMAATAPASPPR
jgi:error-prone DNA polymerase